MKKFFVGLFVLLLCSMNFKKELIATVNLSPNYEAYDVYELKFDIKQLSTKNFTKYINNVKVISIKPFINELYIDKLNFTEYKFNHLSIQSNINRFSNYFIELLNSNGYKQDALKGSIEGVFIKKVVVYGTIQEIEGLKNNLSFKLYNS